MITRTDLMLDLYNYCDGHECEGCIFRKPNKNCALTNMENYPDKQIDAWWKQAFHDGCRWCKYVSCTEYDEPCCKCKNGLLPSDAGYNTAKDMWEYNDENEKIDASTAKILDSCVGLKDLLDKSSAVDHPNHYNRHGAMECIDEMILVFGKEATQNFCLLNAWKYRYRAADKNGEEDLHKSDWYLQEFKRIKES